MILTDINLLLQRMRDELFRRGAMRGLPGLPPHDPYLEATRRYAQAASAAAGLPNPYGSNACYSYTHY